VFKNQASKAFFLAIGLSAILPFIPILKYGLLPFDLLNTHLHEMFHALAAVISGGQVDHIEVYKTGEGVTLTRGGLAPLIMMSGYLGASLFGALMIVTCRSEKSSMIWLRVLASFVLVSDIIWVRGDLVGWTLGLAWPVVIFFASARLKGESLIFAAQFLAVQQCLNSVKSLRDLVILSGSNVTTDAQMLANDTHIPAVVWALLWAAVSLAGIVLAVIKINGGPKQPKPSEPLLGQPQSGLMSSEFVRQPESEKS
jgi:Peptidase M50B-like